VKVELTAKVVKDGSVALEWQSDFSAHTIHLLVMRSAQIPAYTALRLSGKTKAYRIDNLGRHQRYRFCVLAMGKSKRCGSAWISITPKQGLAPREDSPFEDLHDHLARTHDLLLMPQQGRLTAWWKLSPGFADRTQLKIWQAETLVKRFDLEPEVTSLSMDSQRGLELENGLVYQVSVRCSYAGMASEASGPVACAPAVQGKEREANAELAQQHLVYPTLSLAPEVDVFGDETGADKNPETTPELAAIICCHCRRPVRWDSWRLRCEGCGAEFIPNGRSDYLEVAKLRFGTCRCCLPKKILIQPAGKPDLSCSHSGKQHIRTSGNGAYQLIEDLPYGLCQCCRPRRPLLRKAGRVRCTKSSEEHVNQAGRWVLLPSSPVFDAAAIDDLLDAGLAEISSQGVSNGRRKNNGGRS
jgi:hypothetical protein